MAGQDRGMAGGLAPDVEVSMMDRTTIRSEVSFQSAHVQ
jgi:hypothetical protein